MSNVLVLHTGGTLGMTGSPLVSDAYASKLVDAVPQIKDLAEVEARVIANLDSSDLGPAQWTKIAKILGEERENFCGFVIVHGTDTMAYSASALSFALRGFGKPVVFTGAQRPLLKTRTDARRNLIDAVEVATLNIPEVAICFDGLLFRGCRATKESAVDYRAFSSPGTLPIARLGVEIRIENLRPQPSEYIFQPEFGRDVRTIVATPTISKKEFLLASQDAPGVVFVSFGLGTSPCTYGKVNEAIAQRVSEGCEVLVISQSFGKVNLDIYENSRLIREAGAIAGGRMGLESATAKLLHTLKNIDDREERKRFLQEDIAGEHAL